MPPAPSPLTNRNAMGPASVLALILALLAAVLGCLRALVKIERWAELRAIERDYARRRALHAQERAARLAEERALALKGKLPRLPAVVWSRECPP